MIIDAIPKQDKQLIGDITEFKTSIDPKNLEFITTLLSSNLYSAPERSFIREIVSNAWDAEVEAGTTNTPVIIKIGNGEVSIRDFGTGISPERFREIYCNIGSSTKRESNDFIGGFGLGRFSALSCSDTVFIDSYYEGTQYSYVMIKDGNAITINLIIQQPTTEKNGVMVSIKNIASLSPYYNALKYIQFFPNVYVDTHIYDKDANNINNHKIRRFTHYAASDVVLDDLILLGNVLYPIDTHFFGGKYYDFLMLTGYSGFVLSFDIGELEITPNRENLIYSSSTIKAIERKIELAQKELFDNIEKCYEDDYSSFSKLYSDYKCIFYDPLNDTLHDNRSYNSHTIRIHDTIGHIWKYCGVVITKEDLVLWGDLLHETLYSVRCLLIDGKIYSTKIPQKYNKFITAQSNIHRVIINHDIKMAASVKEYFASQYRTLLILSELNVKKMSPSTIAPYQPLYERCTAPNKELIAQLFLKYLNDNGGVEVFDPSCKEYIDFKEQQKAANKGVTRKKNADCLKQFSIYDMSHGFRKELYMSDVTDLVRTFKYTHKGVVLVPCSSPYIPTLQDLCKAKDLAFFTANRQVVKAVENLRLSNMVSVDYLLHDDPQLAFINAYEKYKPQIKKLYDDYGKMQSFFYNTLPTDLRTKFIDMWSNLDRYTSIFNYGTYATKCGRSDSYTELLLQSYIDHVEAFTMACDIASNNVVYIGAVLMKSKSYRISYDLYKSIKKNKFISLICRKK